MAQYMYSAKGTDGQYATYENWASKLYDVYINLIDEEIPTSLGMFAEVTFKTNKKD